MSIEAYQTRIIKPSEIVDYISWMMVNYTADNLRCEPMVGFKVLLRDLNCYSCGSQSARFQQIEQSIRFFLQGSGCILRETHPTESADGFWLISFPVSRAHVTQQLQTMMQVVARLSEQLGIVSTQVIEVNVSGHCPATQTEASMSQINLPPVYARFLVEPQTSAYKLGHTIRISDEYLMLRTMWNFGDSPVLNESHLSDLVVISQLLTVMFH